MEYSKSFIIQVTVHEETAVEITKTQSFQNVNQECYKPLLKYAFILTELNARF